MEPLSISWSSLKAHEHCRQQMYLTRQGKKNPAQNIRNFFHGMVVDAVMREWLHEDDPQPGVMVSRIDAAIDEQMLKAAESGDGVVRWKHRADRKEMAAFCKELVVRLEPILYDLILKYEFEPAKRFRAPISIPDLNGNLTSIYLSGEIDLLVRDDERQWQVWDLKGTANDSYWRQTIAQLTFYDLAIHAMFGEYTVKAGLIQPMCAQRVIPVTITEKERLDMMSRIIRMAHFMWRGDWQPTESTSGCSYCAVRHACAKFKPAGDVAKRRLSLERNKLGDDGPDTIIDLL